MSKKPRDLLAAVKKEIPRSLIKTRAKTLQSVSSPASPEQSPKHASSKSSTFLTSSRTIDNPLPFYRPTPAFILLPSPKAKPAKPPLSRPYAKASRPKSTTAASLCNTVTRCGFKTRTGSILSRPKKHNQDAYIIAPLLGTGQYLFGVCDGHGANGHAVSRLIREILPKCVEQAMPLSGDWQERLKVGLDRGIAKAEEILEASDIDVKRSGSTCIAVGICGTTLVCANVGDSRAIIIREQLGTWSFEPLSIDHKPSLTREYQRILSCGGRVSPYRKANGDPLGPPRVWLSKDSGLAMSRSLGDTLARAVGIISEPELIHWTMSKQDRALVVASDGLWEFLSNQEVAEIVGMHWAESDIEGTCDSLVRAAVKGWRSEELIDDITVLVVYLRV